MSAGGARVLRCCTAPACAWLLTVCRRHRLWQDKGGVIPALQRLSYAGKNLEDAQRTLEQ